MVTHAQYPVPVPPSKLYSTPDSDIIPSVLYSPTSSVTSRGRTHSRTYEWFDAQQERKERKNSKSSASGSQNGEGGSRRGSDGEAGEAVQIDAQTISAHHSLPEVGEEISGDPILFLPPLLSPLPEHADDHAPEHDHDHSPVSPRARPHTHRTGSHSHSPLARSRSPHSPSRSPRTRAQAIPVPSPPPSSSPGQDSREKLAEGGEQVDPLRDFETRLPDIDPASLALHQALHRFKPTTGAYAATPYPEAFNWANLSLPKSTEREWYCVVFRSRRKPESAHLSLYKADREAHEEAVKNGGLIMYWYGVPDSTGLNLATCIWQSRRHAIKAISGPKHMSAMKQTEGAYETYSLERWRLVKEAGRRDLQLRKWEGGDVGW
ncbi:hypothetical protein IAT38_004529 [Cryptococcus sp. DSM 104549]